MLEVLYLLFNEGYSASQGNEIIRWDLCREAIRGRLSDDWLKQLKRFALSSFLAYEVHCLDA